MAVHKWADIRRSTLRPPPIPHLQVADPDAEKWKAKSRRKGVVMRVIAGLAMTLGACAAAVSFGWFVVFAQAVALGIGMSGIAILWCEFYLGKR